MKIQEKIANIQSDRKQFFFKWIEFTRPFHKLRNQLQTVLALLLYHHYELGQVISNETILWKQVFDYDTKVLIMNEMNIQPQSLENLLTELRKNKVIIDNKVVPVFVPNIQKDTEHFTVKINFKINE